MSSGVRSDRLASGTVLSGQQVTVVTVAAGRTVIVKSLYGYANVNAVGPVQFAVKPLAGTAVIVQETKTTAQSAYRWDGWLAMDEGAALLLWNGTGGTVQYYVSGADLPGSAPARGVAKPTGEP